MLWFQKEKQSLHIKCSFPLILIHDFVNFAKATKAKE